MLITGGSSGKPDAPNALRGQGYAFGTPIVCSDNAVGVALLKRKASLAINTAECRSAQHYIKRILFDGSDLGDVTVTGEISNLVFHRSGHVYFALKDQTSRISCFLAGERAQRLRYEISDGMQVIAAGGVAVYERGGTYSLNIRELDPAGLGDLHLAFENLKKKLLDEGLFDPSKKKPLPAQIARIGVITSPTGAAVHDIITAVQRRNPLVDIRIFPCLVQGEQRPASIGNNGACHDQRKKSTCSSWGGAEVPWRTCGPSTRKLSLAQLRHRASPSFRPSVTRRISS